MAKRRRRNPDLFDSIRVGDRVTIVNRFGQERSGRATIHNRDADVWVLNMGGAHGTPGIATRDNVVRVTGAKRRNPGAYRHKRIRAPGRFVKRSFRLTGKRGGTRVVVGKLKGERRRVTRGPRKGRAVLLAQAILTPKRRRNPHSEATAWATVTRLAAELAAGKAAGARIHALQLLARRMAEQVARGIHANPPKATTTLSRDVQAVLYRHLADGQDYVHPFGQGVSVANKQDGSTVVRAAKSARSGVRATLLDDGSVHLWHPSKPLWRDF